MSIFRLRGVQIDSPERIDLVRYHGVADVDDTVGYLRVDCEIVVGKPAKAFNVDGLLAFRIQPGEVLGNIEFFCTCLLYTSDAADE